jgi:hypothetical protein
MKKLFSDPHFNVMDGLDIYIDDYSIAEPIPPSMLEKMYQSTALGLFQTITNTENSTKDENLSIKSSLESNPKTSQVSNETLPAKPSMSSQALTTSQSIEDEKNQPLKVEKNDDNVNL